MAKLRSVSMSFWSDTWVEELSPAEKLIYLYLITNDKTNMLGIYESSIKKISNETDLDKETVSKALKGFENDKKVVHVDNKYIVLVNYLKHQNYNGNMKKSAIEIHNKLPKLLKVNGVNLDKNNPLESFERLSNHSLILSKAELELELELETEEELEEEEKTSIKKFLMSEINISDVEDCDKDNYEIAKAFYQVIEKNLIDISASTAHLKKQKYKDWIDTIRLMLKNKEANRDQFKAVYSFLQKNEFWKPNIQSPKKLREKFTTLYAKSQQKDDRKRTGYDTSNFTPEGLHRIIHGESKAG